MTPMTFDAYARHQVQVLFDAFADRLVKDLSNASSEQAQALAAQARAEAERAAEAALAAARTDADARLSAAQAMNAGLLASVEAAREEVRVAETVAQQEVRAAETAAQEELRAAEAATREAVRAAQSATKIEVRAAQAAAQAAAQEEVRAAQAAAQEEVRAARAAAQEELRAAQAAVAENVRAAQEAGRAESERVQEELAARLDDRERALHAARQDAQRAKDALDGARQESTVARMEADRYRQDRELVVERMGTALSTIDRATSPGEILEAVLEPLGHEFARAAVFLVGPSSLNGWRGRGLDGTTDVAKLVVLRSHDSPLARAVAERKRFFMTASPEEPLVGMLGMFDAVTHAVALPVLAGEQVIAVAYAENVSPMGAPATAQVPAAAFPGVACKIVEMLIDHAMLRLVTKHAAPGRPTVPHEAQPAAYSPARQARRLKVQKGIHVTLDGAESSLVDLSSIGAQLLSPLAMPPNRMVKMTLRTKEAALACKGRVIWARFEQPRGTIAARYRVGVKFTDIEGKALEGLMSRHGIAEAAAR